MAHIIDDRVRETSTTTGTGSLTLAGVVAGYQSFDDAMANGDTCFYCIKMGSAWEVGLGTYSSSSVLARTTVYSSSNGDAAVNFTSGTKDVFITMPACFLHPVDLTPSQITANQNDYSPSGLATASVLRLDTDAARTMTGLDGGFDGRRMLLVNKGSYTLTLANESASSTAANRFSLGADFYLAAGQSLELIYDATASRWRPTSATLVSDIPYSLALRGDLTPSQITANQNDYSPSSLSTAAVLRLDSDAARTITGLAGGADGRILVLHNIGSYAITLADASASSSAANRFDFGADLHLGPKQTAALIYDSTLSRWRLVTGPAVCNAGAGRLTYVGATSIKFAPFNGDRVKIAGVWYPIPSAGVTAANTGVYVNGTGGQNLAADTTYYVYVFNNAGTLTIDFSTTAYADDTTLGNLGVKIKTGDSSRSLIGMVRTNSSSQFSDSASSRLVLSWFNRRPRALEGPALSGATRASSTIGEVSATAQTKFLTWADAATTIKARGYAGSDAVCNIGSYIGLDTTGTGYSGAPFTQTVPTANYIYGIAPEYVAELADGYHYATILGNVTAGTGSWTGLISGSVLG